MYHKFAVILSILFFVKSAYGELNDFKIVKNHCSACHTFEKNEPPGYGPNLYNVVGRCAGVQKAFTYSDAFLSSMKGKVWTTELLQLWLADTQALVPGSRMTYFQSDQRVIDIIIRFLVSKTDASNNIGSSHMEGECK